MEINLYIKHLFCHFHVSRTQVYLSSLTNRVGATEGHRSCIREITLNRSVKLVSVIIKDCEIQVLSRDAHHLHYDVIVRDADRAHSLRRLRNNLRHLTHQNNLRTISKSTEFVQTYFLTLHSHIFRHCAAMMTLRKTSKKC